MTPATSQIFTRKVLLILFVCVLTPAVSPKEYFLFNDTELNWFAAFHACHLKNMTLATINSEAEQIDIGNLIGSWISTKKVYWTSGTDQAKEGEFVWMSTGQPIRYKNWYYGEPNNHGSQHCLTISNINSHQWDDDQCSNKYFYICEEKTECSREIVFDLLIS